MKRTYRLLSPTWKAARTPVKGLDGQWPSDGWRRLPHEAGAVGDFRIALTPSLVELAGAITEPAGRDTSCRNIHPEWYFRDHVVLFLDPGHDHVSRRMVAVLRDGGFRTEDIWCLRGEEISDTFQTPLPAPPLEPDVRVKETATGWRFRVRVARARLSGAVKDSGESGPIGIQLRLGFAGATLQPAVCWPPVDPCWQTTPFGFGDVVEAGAPFEIKEVDFGAPVWKTAGISSRIRIKGRIRDARRSCGVCRIAVIGTDGRREEANYAWRGRGGNVFIQAPVDYPFTSKWAPDCLKTACLEIAIEDARGRLLWKAGYPFGFDAGVIVREPYGLPAAAKQGTHRPAADDPEFVDRYRAWLLNRLPDWRWTTTQAGAPSDFYLRARRRDDDIDLMNPKVMENLARLIRGRFDDWQDGLCAAAMALHHPCLTTHSSSWSRISAGANAATTLRLGGCFCSETAKLAACLASRLGKLYGVALKGFTLGLRGHLSGLVETPLGEVLIDPMLGIYYHTLDNRRLATLEEMRTEPRIVERMWALPRSSDGAPFFDGIRNQIKRPWCEGLLVYPPSGEPL